MKNILKYLIVAIHDGIKHDGVEHAGYLSFLIMLSIFPFLLLFVSAASFIGTSELTQTLLSFILNSTWSGFIDALTPRIVEITSSPPQRILTIAILSAIWTASSIFEGMRTILNRSYRVTSPPPYITRRMFSILEFFIMLGIIIAVTFSLVVLPTIWNIIGKFFSIPQKFILAPEAKEIRSLILIAFLFFTTSAFYYFLPNRISRFKHSFPGAFLMVICSTIFTSLFKIYLYNVHSINIIYGSIAGVIVALLYFYFCSLIFIIGGEFNYQCEKHIFKEMKK
jgi:membrane protein